MLNPMALALASGCGYVARGYSGQPKHLMKLYQDGIQYPGFALIDVFSPCVTFNKVILHFGEFAPAPGVATNAAWKSSTWKTSLDGRGEGRFNGRLRPLGRAAWPTSPTHSGTGTRHRVVGPVANRIDY
jgi:pyruvate/2-oxoacid:ferredoxin oxidoreductase beta subunit